MAGLLSLVKPRVRAALLEDAVGIWTRHCGRTSRMPRHGSGHVRGVVDGGRESALVGYDYVKSVCSSADRFARSTEPDTISNFTC